jgi:hypothetical protein
MTKLQRKRRNIAKARQARKYGARYSRTIADEAAKAGIPYAVAFASIEQESGFQNIFGHDPGGLYWGQPVTNAKVAALLRHVAAGGTSNGVGFSQLTYPPFIREAHCRRGGAAKVRNQVAVGFKLLADLRRQHGTWHEAFRAYNGTGPAAVRYAHMMDDRVESWQRRLKL